MASRYTFQTLSPSRRDQFARTNRGFLAWVQRRLAARGIEKSLATISRTWHGFYQTPDPEILSELDAEYRAITERPVEVDRNGGADGAENVPGSDARDVGAREEVRPKRLANAAERRVTGDPSASRTGQKTSIPGGRVSLRVQARSGAREAWLRYQLGEMLNLQHNDLQPRPIERKTLLNEIYLMVPEVADILGISSGAARGVLQKEADVLYLQQRGAAQARIRVPLRTVARIIRRDSCPLRTRPAAGAGASAE